jgi:hypothetical protein
MVPSLQGLKVKAYWVEAGREAISSSEACYLLLGRQMAQLLFSKEPLEVDTPGDLFMPQF